MTRIGTVWCMIFFVFISAITVVSSANAEAELKKASLMLLWSPQAQFAGYYTALSKGFYRKQGVDLTIIPGGPGRSTADCLINGKADFAILWLTTALQYRSMGDELVNVAQAVQKSSMMLVAMKSSGIKTPADLNNKKVGLWGGNLSIPAHTFFKQYGVQVHEVPQSYTVNLFLRRGIDAASAMWYNEYHTILNSGINPEELTLFFLNEHGQNFPEDGIYTLGKTLRNDPSIAAAIATASMDGWYYAFEHPDEALDIIMDQMSRANLPANRMHQKWMLERMRDLMMPGNDRKKLGVLNRTDYDSVGNVLMKNKLIRAVPDYKSFYGGANADK